MSTFVVLKTTANKYRKLYTTTNTASSFANLVPTTTAPSGEGVLKIAPREGSMTDNAARFLFVSNGSDNATYKARIVIWNEADDLWIPEIIGNLDLTASTATGNANSTYLNNTFRFADTITLTSSTSNTTHLEIISPANNTPGSVAVDLAGAQIVQILLDANGTNVLYRIL
jgi:hypothetical protein